MKISLDIIENYNKLLFLEAILMMQVAEETHFKGKFVARLC
jgi:hypothetical protein